MGRELQGGSWSLGTVIRVSQWMLSLQQAEGLCSPGAALGGRWTAAVSGTGPLQGWFPPPAATWHSLSCVAPMHLFPQKPIGWHLLHHLRKPGKIKMHPSLRLTFSREMERLPLLQQVETTRLASACLLAAANVQTRKGMWPCAQASLKGKTQLKAS